MGSPPLSVVSTRPATRKACASSHDASTRTPVTRPSVDVTTPALSIVSTRPAAPKSTTPNQDASTRTPMTSMSVTHQIQKSTVQEQSDVVKCWLIGVGSGAALSGEELAEALRAAAPEIYED